MWGATGPLAPQGLVLMEGSHLLWPDGPQATAGWHCPERPGAQGPGSPIPSPSSAWNLPCCPQRFGLEGACPRALPIAEAWPPPPTGGSGWGGREQVAMRSHPSNSKHSPAAHHPGSGHKEEQWARKASPGSPAVLGWASPDTPSACGPSQTPPQPVALYSDGEGGRDRELGMKSSSNWLGAQLCQSQRRE